MRHLLPFARCLFACAVIFLVMVTLAFACGCAVGRGPAGEVVAGVKVGQLVETAGEAAAAVAQAAGAALPKPIGDIVTPLATLLLGGGAVGGAAWHSKRSEDKAWTESRQEFYRDLALQTARRESPSG